MMTLCPPLSCGSTDYVSDYAHHPKQLFQKTVSSLPTSFAPSADYDECGLYHFDPFRPHQVSEYGMFDLARNHITLKGTSETADVDGCLDESTKSPIVLFNGSHIEWLNTQGWNILREFHHGGGFNGATRTVDAMVKQNMMVPSVVFSQLLQGCIEEKDLLAGRQVLCLIIGSGCEADYMLGSSLVHLFAVCGSLVEAIQGFCRLQKRNVISWTALIEAYHESGQNEQAIQAYYELQKLNLNPDGHVFVAALKACSSVATAEHSKHIHAHILDGGLDSNVYIGSTLINMYAECGSLNEAYYVFERLKKTSVVIWGSMITGYLEHGRCKDALELFQHMEREGIEPNEVIFICILKACSSLMALENGKRMHFQIVQMGFETLSAVGNSLIDMYSKCGSLDDATIILNRMVELDSISWSTIIGGYAKHSNYEMASQVFHCMQKMNIKPTGITYLSILSACSHGGHCDEGCMHFKRMMELHGVWPTLGHYNAIVDILGRSGHLDKAEDAMETIPFGSNHVGWCSVLDACRLKKDVARGRRCFDRFVSMENGSAVGYVIMSNIYAQAGLWEDYNKIQELRKYANMNKKPAIAHIEINNFVHEFIVDDHNHPQADKIYEKLNSLDAKMTILGYTRESIKPSPSRDGMEQAICGHSERLAVAFGLLSTASGTTIRVAKNLRVCADCHNAMKHISNIELRQIIISDAYRIHHFKDGLCCCEDEYT